MDIIAFPAKFDPQENGGFVVSFRDVPEALTQGDDLEEARAMAQDALAIAMDFYFESGRKVPDPSLPEEGEEWIGLSAELSQQVRAFNPPA